MLADPFLRLLLPIGVRNQEMTDDLSAIPLSRLVVLELSTAWYHTR